MVKNNEKLAKTAIFPIFSFQASEELAKEIKNGFRFSNKVILRQIEKEELTRFKKTFPYFLVS